MECHCNDHLPGDWHSHEDCDCLKSPNTTYSFVVTKVIDDFPGTGAVFISKTFMENLELSDGDAVEILGPHGCIVQAKSHPNSWIDTRMVSFDRDTMDRTGFQMFSQVRIRKAVCVDAESVTLQAPVGIDLTKQQIRSMLDKVDGVVLAGSEFITLETNRGETIRFKIFKTEPNEICKVSPGTRIGLVDENGQEYVSSKETYFNDVGGLHEAVSKVREVVQLPLKHPEIFYRLGIDPPRGVLLYGPSGTGKTLIARAVAAETGCWFKSVVGSEIMAKHYGESEAKLRAAFEDAYKHAPAIIFIDEIDALAPRRDTSEGEVERRVTAQLLALMDGLEDRGEVMVLAATNLPNNLDPALRRPGRFDREIIIGVPDVAGRREIIEIHTRNMPLGPVNLDDFAEKIHGFVGADIKSLCQEAAYEALRRSLPGLEDTEQQLSEDFLEALTVESCDFESALKNMRPSSGRRFEVNLSGAGWDNIAGFSKEVEFLKETILWPLRNGAFLEKLGVNRPSGLLLTGPSGVGKTLMARSIAKESGFNVIEIRGPELLSKYMGESERNIRELFRQTRELAPTVLIVDSVDSFATSGWSDSKVIDRIVNQLVLEMNSIKREKPILVVATAVRADDVAPALRATGRFSRELQLHLPTNSDRELIFLKYLSRDRISYSDDYSVLARESENLSCGDIEEICRMMILNAAKVAMEEKDCALEKLRLTENEALRAIDQWKLMRSL
ncbi:MAG: AAA family ATPase [Desulfomonilaceae bacterium]